MFAVTLYLHGQEAPVAMPSTEIDPSSWLKIYKDGYIGYINHQGINIIPPIYEEIGKPGDYQEN